MKKYKKGDRVLIQDSRKGKFFARLTKDSDANAESIQCVLDQDISVQGLTTEWRKGDDISSCNGLAKIVRLAGSKDDGKPSAKVLSIPISLWGKDHWSTFAYLETCLVDHGGKIELPRMRCNPILHRQFEHFFDGSKYPTRLKGKKEQADHDDWSCVEDMQAAGLLKMTSRKVRQGFSGTHDASVQFTDIGYAIAGQLRKHKGQGGNFSEFEPTEFIKKQRPR